MKKKWIRILSVCLLIVCTTGCGEIEGKENQTNKMVKIVASEA